MSPSLKVSPWPGVLVTPSQSLPPIMSSLGVPSSASLPRLVKFHESSSIWHLTSFLLPPAWSQWLRRGQFPAQGGVVRHSLMSVDDGRQVNLARLNSILQNRGNSIEMDH